MKTKIFLIFIVAIFWHLGNEVLAQDSMANTKNVFSYVYTPNQVKTSRNAIRAIENGLDLRTLVKYNQPQLDKSISQIQMKTKAMGGTNGAGGGGGVACLLTPSKGLLLENIRDLYTFEYWEWEITQEPKIGSQYMQPQAHESVDQYLRRILQQKLGSTNSPFLSLLNESINFVLIQINKSENQVKLGELPYKNDRGILYDNVNEVLKESGCIPVQLAWRELEEKQDSRGYRIKIDTTLFNRLGLLDSKYTQPTRIMNQAMLILHEALYLIGDQIQLHPTSYHVRLLVNWLFTQQIPKTSVTPLQFRYELYSTGFDHYYHLVKPSNSEFHSDKSERRDAYQNIVLQFGNLRRVFFPYVASNVIYDSQFVRNPLVLLKSNSIYIRGDIFEPHYNHIIAEDWRNAINEYIIPNLSEAEALVLLGRLYFDDIHLYNNIKNQFEDLLIDSVDDRETTRILCGNFPKYDSYLNYSLDYTQALRRRLSEFCRKY